jgi:4-diphosphocytidyl-2-C-methyl-D-erythritol kinase
MAAAFSEPAFAKINLALHVRRRREDGYHEIESLFAFVDSGDLISIDPSDEDRLTITGEFAAGLSSGPDNLVLRALAMLRAMRAPGETAVPPLAITLEKNLPVASGIGGGSADAAALIRLVARCFPAAGGGDNRELILAARSLGADVGACIVSETRIGRGLGDDLAVPGENDVTGMAVLLVNPLVPVPTGPVFAAWDGIDRGPLPEGSVLSAAKAGRNDLEAPARTLCPEIDDVMAVLRAQLPLLTRMSGSGATCFAIFTDIMQCNAAQARLATDHPEWWTMAGRLR